MIKSMTGFGRCELSEGERKVSVEIKTVNHRYLDVAMKMPKKLNFFDSAIRTVLKEYLQRGKVDVFVTYEDLSESNVSLVYNQKVAEQYVKYFRQMEEQFGLENDMKVSVLARCPEVLVMEEQQEDEEEIWQLLEKAVRGACEKVVETRVREGEALRCDLLAKLDEMQVVVDRVAELAPDTLKQHADKVRERVAEYLKDVSIDEGKFLNEMAFYADKVAVDEELTRLNSHIPPFRAILTKGGAVGKQLDFVVQEMNRESNTIGSKCNDIRVAECVVSLKCTIEKLREQIQNLE